MRFRLSAGASFWVMVAAYAGLMLAASAPSPLYPVYQARWHFSAITLTAVFGVYALVLLLALLTAGGLSDYIGRKPVLLAGLTLLVASMVVFARADGVAWLYAARVLQGLAAGLSLGAVSAGIIDFAGPRRLPLATIMNSLIPMAGLALGALVAGGLVQFAPAPEVLVFVLLGALFVVVIVALVAAPEPVPRRAGALSSLVPRVRVSRPIRGDFARAVPGLVAPWAQIGFTLSLTPTLAAVKFGIADHFADAAVVAAVCGSAFVSTIVTRRARPLPGLAAGCAGLIIGAGLTLASLAGPSDSAFYAGSVLTGLGAGATLGCVTRALSMLPAPGERSEFFAAMYVVGYLAFSVPAIIAGVVVVAAGLVTATVGYGVGVSLLALIALAGALWPARPAGGQAEPRPAAGRLDAQADEAGLPAARRPWRHVAGGVPDD